MERLRLNEILFGKTDAFNELIELGQDFFVDAFVNNEKYHMNDFLQGKKYYICGKKGTGKTAFLRYLECSLESPEHLIIPLRFKSDFDDVDKEQFIGSTLNTKEKEAASEKEAFSSHDIISQKSYVLMWKTFLINQVIQQARSKELSVFVEDERFNCILDLLHVLYGDSDNGGIVMPKLKKGTIELSSSLSSKLSAKVKLDIDFDPKNKKVNYQKTAKTILRLFNELTFSKIKVYVFIDELELSVRNKSMHQKDVMLVRDLILSIDELNKTCSQRCYEIRFISAVRSEVINNVLSAGYEINKCIEDYGITIEWFQKGGNYKDNQLLRIIENKIHASEKQKGLTPSQDVWSTYFEKTIHGIEVRKYILNNTWYRPRDIIRLMTLLQSSNNDGTVFNQQSFDSAQQEYSTRMWSEFSEELILSYSSDDIKAIKSFLNRIELPFTFDYLKTRASKMGEIYPNIKAFFEKVSMAEFLEKMFTLGIVGNTGGRMVFYFLGDQDLSLVDPMVIHNPLRNFFAVQSQKNN